MKHRHHLGAGGGQAPADGVDQRVEAARFADSDPAVRQGARRLTEQFAVAHGAHQLRLGVAWRHPLQLVQGLDTEDAVDGEANVALEFGEGGGGVLPEDAVDPPGVEAESRQSLLQLSDVVAAQHGLAQVQQAPLTKAVAGFHQSGPGLGTADAVDPQATSVLKGLHCCSGSRPEATRRIGRRDEAGLVQAVLQIVDRVTSVAHREGKLGWSALGAGGGVTADELHRYR